jgi:hypothetical protein
MPPVSSIKATDLSADASSPDRGLNQAEASGRAEPLAVERYDVHLDLTGLAQGKSFRASRGGTRTLKVSSTSSAPPAAVTSESGRGNGCGATRVTSSTGCRR